MKLFRGKARPLLIVIYVIAASPVMNSDVIFVDKHRAIPYDGLNFDGATGFNYKIAYILSYARDQAEYGEFVKAYGITHVE